MKLTGTMWRAKSGGPTMWGNITDRPATYTDVVNNAVKTMGVIRPGDVILVVSERTKFSTWHVDSHLESVQVATPVHGWCNATYFTSESIWLERIA